MPRLVVSVVAARSVPLSEDLLKEINDFNNHAGLVHLRLDHGALIAEGRCPLPAVGPDALSVLARAAAQVADQLAKTFTVVHGGRPVHPDHSHRSPRHGPPTGGTSSDA